MINNAFVSDEDQTSGTEHGSPPVEQHCPNRRVLVIDGHLFVADVIVLALIQLGFTARLLAPITADHARELVAWRPGVVLLDVESVDRPTCLSIVSTLSGANVPVAAMGRGSDGQLLEERVRAGASVVLDKRSPLTELVGVIAKVLTGDTALDDETQSLPAPPGIEPRVRRSGLDLFTVLTRREKYVLAQLMNGHGAEDVAARSYVSVSTVRSQIKSILQKLGVNSQLAATSLAFRAGWCFAEGGGTSDLPE